MIGARRAAGVEDKGALASAAAEVIRRIVERIRAADAISGGRERSLLAVLDAAADSVERAIDEVERGRGRQANTALRAAIKQLGAFLNRFDGAADAGGEPVPARLEVSIEHQAEGAIENIVAARDASI